MENSGEINPDILKRAGDVIASAIENEKPTQIYTLVTNGFPVDTAFQANKMNALHLAASFGSQKMLQSLLEMGADPNVRDSLGRTALHFACKRGS